VLIVTEELNLMSQFK